MSRNLQDGRGVCCEILQRRGSCEKELNLILPELSVLSVGRTEGHLRKVRSFVVGSGEPG